MKIKIEINKQLDEAAVASVLEQISREIINQELEDKELMDGSFPVDTYHGVAYISFDNE